MNIVTTGPDFAEEHVLDDGTRVLLRHIRKDDGPALRRGFAQLSPESRYHRFNGWVRELSDAQVRFFTEVDGINHVAIVAIVLGAEEHGVGVARFVRDPNHADTAELAVTVVDEEQHKGLGTILVEALERAARERGVEHLNGQFGADNEPMRRLLKDVGARVDGRAGTDTLFDVPVAQAVHEGAAPAGGGRLAS